MNVLVINCGSSSIKYQFIDSDTEKVLAKGLCDRIGIDGSQITYQPGDGDKEVTVTPMPDHTVAVQLVIDKLTNDKTGVINFGYDNADFTAKYVFNMGKTASEYAANIFYALREFDDSDVEEIYAIPPKDDGVGIAVRNRIYKSAGGKTI